MLFQHAEKNPPPHAAPKPLRIRRELSTLPYFRYIEAEVKILPVFILGFAIILSSAPDGIYKKAKNLSILASYPGARTLDPNVKSVVLYQLS